MIIALHATALCCLLLCLNRNVNGAATLLKTVIAAARTSLNMGEMSAGSMPRPSFEAQEQAADGFIARLQCYLFRSAIMPDDRIVSVYLPPQYELEPERRFPVFYMHDGQNLFDPRTSYIPDHTWRAGETADRLNASGEAEPMILVGAANTGLRRMAEYTPTRDYRMGGGEGRQYGRLLVEELKPWVDATFRTQPGAAKTGLGGSSLGGLITLDLGLQYPDVYGRLAVISPSVWWDQRSILNVVATESPSPRPKIWLDIGTAEGLRHVRDTELLYRRLVQQGWQPEVDLKFAKIEGGFHSEDAWADRFDRVLRFLFPLEP